MELDGGKREPPMTAVGLAAADEVLSAESECQ